MVNKTKNKRLNVILLSGIIGLFSFANITATDWQSKIVYFGQNGKLVYQRDKEGNRIPDFSYAGYKGGGIALPDVPVVKTISAVSGDNTQNIQNAINEVGSYPINNNGIRGALLLLPGKYEINGTLKINYDGVILRGSGDGADDKTNTILIGKGDAPHQRTIIIAGGGSLTRWKEQVSGTKTNIVSDTVSTGDNSFEVESSAQFSVGDNIIIYHPCTDEWLKAIDYGGTASTESGAEPGVDLPWAVNSNPIVFNRHITKIEGNIITIDAPVFNHLIRNLSQAYIYKYARTGIKTNIGIENLRIDIEYKSETDENHAWQAIDFYQIEDSWIKDCTMLHFGQSAIRTATATQITVQECKALDPKALVDGERRYNFQVYTASQQILFYKCYASNGRHHYMSNGTTYTSGCVFLDCTSQGAYTSSEGHRQWSMALLYDNVTDIDGPRAGVDPRLLGLYNRGNYGTSHGWATANSVAWRYNASQGDIVIQKPPTAQNYAIGCFGKNVTGKHPPAPFNQAEGYIEGVNKDSLNPRSLYLAQLNERLSTTGMKGLGDNIKPDEFKLLGNYPNPFNPSTTIQYILPEKMDVNLTIYDSTGREVKTLVRGLGNKGMNFAVWDGRDNSGDRMSSGVYIYRIFTETGINSAKMLMLK